MTWVCAVALTVALSVWQRRSGPTYAVGGTVTIEGQTVRYRLERSFAGGGDAPVRIPAGKPALKGTVDYRLAGSNGGWTTVEMVREGDSLVGWLPHQPIAGKLEYSVVLRGESVKVWLKPVTIRFRGDVPTALLVPHILAMFLGFLFAARAGLAVINREEPRPFVVAALLLIGIGGLILGPLVQKIGLGDYWTGWPFGPDLTDNKTLVAWLVWLPPLFSRRGRWVALAAIVTFLVFAIPHSVLSGNLEPGTYKVVLVDLRDSIGNFAVSGSVQAQDANGKSGNVGNSSHRAGIHNSTNVTSNQPIEFEVVLK